ncbi:GntR family transcriptional regulator [Arthrobacter sp. Z4-13]
MSAGIFVDLRSAVPPYEQIRSQISSLVAVGALSPGTRLPTVRSLAADLGIAAGTVARAYKELEAAGLVEARRRGGTVVTGPLPESTGTQGTVPGTVTAAVERYIEAGRKAQLSDEVLLDLLRGRLRKS